MAYFGVSGAVEKNKISYNVLRIRDVALIRMLKSRHNATVPYFLYAVMCWADFQH
jgi:hypothetical protein